MGKRGETLLMKMAKVGIKNCFRFGRDDEPEFNKRLEFIDYSIIEGEIFYFEYNSRNCVGVFSIFNSDGEILRQVNYHGFTREKFVSGINEMSESYRRIF